MKLEEFDESLTTIINPKDIVLPIQDCPEIVVTCFANNLIDYGIEKYPNRIIGFIDSANVRIPLYELKVGQYKIG